MAAASSLKYTVIKGYRFEALIGEGSYGKVYRVTTGDGKQYAAKLVDNRHCARIQREILAEIAVMSELNHPNILKIEKVVYEYYSSAERIVIIMPLMQSTLSRALSAESPPTTEQRLKWAFQIFSALTYVHARGFLHLDVKPPNVLIDAKGDAFLADFGLAENEFNANEERAPNRHITYKYRSPEFLCNINWYTSAADWWSYGLLLLYLFFFYDTDRLSPDEDKFLETIRKLGWPKGWADLVATYPASCALECKDVTTKLQESPENMMHLLLGGNEKYYEKLYDDLYLRLQNLIAGCLQVDPRERTTAAAADLFGDRLDKIVMGKRVRKPTYHTIFSGLGFLKEPTVDLASHIWQRTLCLCPERKDDWTWKLAAASIACKLMNQFNLSDCMKKKPEQLSGEWKTIPTKGLYATLAKVEPQIALSLNFRFWDGFYISVIPIAKESSYVESKSNMPPSTPVYKEAKASTVALSEERKSPKKEPLASAVVLSSTALSPSAGTKGRKRRRHQPSA